MSKEQSVLKSIFWATVLLTVFLGLILIKPVSAQIFPAGSQSEMWDYHHDTGVLGDMILATSTRTILHASFHADGTSEGELYCGTTVATGINIFDTMGQNVLDTPMSFLCQNFPLWLVTTSNQGKGIDLILTWFNDEVATTTVNAIIQPEPMQEIFYGIVIFFLICGSVLYLFRRMI